MRAKSLATAARVNKERNVDREEERGRLVLSELPVTGMAELDVFLRQQDRAKQVDGINLGRALGIAADPNPRSRRFSCRNCGFYLPIAQWPTCPVRVSACPFHLRGDGLFNLWWKILVTGRITISGRRARGSVLLSVANRNAAGCVESDAPYRQKRMVSTLQDVNT